MFETHIRMKLNTTTTTLTTTKTTMSIDKKNRQQRQSREKAQKKWEQANRRKNKRKTHTHMTHKVEIIAALHSFTIKYYPFKCLFSQWMCICPNVFCLNTHMHDKILNSIFVSSLDIALYTLKSHEQQATTTAAAAKKQRKNMSFYLLQFVLDNVYYYM